MRDMDRFIIEQNLERFRRLASVTTSEPKRKILFELLGAEEAKFMKLRKVRIEAKLGGPV
jgi:hypothetical protein